MFLLEQVVNGLVLGGYYLLIALGLSLIFSVGGVVNLAHGAFYAFGAYVAVALTNYVGFGPAIVISPVAEVVCFTVNGGASFGFDAFRSCRIASHRADEWTHTSLKT